MPSTLRTVLTRTRRAPISGIHGYKTSSPSPLNKEPPPHLSPPRGTKSPSSLISATCPNDDPLPNAFYLHRLLTAVAGAWYPELVGVTRGEVEEACSGSGLFWRRITTWNPSLPSLHGDTTANVLLARAILDGIVRRQSEEGLTVEGRRQGRLPPTSTLSDSATSGTVPIASPRDTVPGRRAAKPFLRSTPSNSPLPTPTAQGLQPHIIALIDGDGYVFKREILREGHSGGLKAAKLFAEAVSERFGRRLDYRLSIYLFMNDKGLFGKLVGTDHRRDSLSFATLRDFMYGFQVPPFNYVIGTGSGKEYVDSKLKELLRVSLRSPDTETVILGVLNDSGYMSSIEGEVLLQDKITLLRGHRNLPAYQARFPHLPTMEIPGLFGPVRLESSKTDATAASTDLLMPRTPSGSVVAPAAGTVKPELPPEPVLRPDSGSERDAESFTPASEAKVEGPDTHSSTFWDDLRAHASALRSLADTKDHDKQKVEGDGTRSEPGVGSSALSIPALSPMWSQQRTKVHKSRSQELGKGDKATRSSSPVRRTKDPKDRRARPGPGVTPRTACKNVWIKENPEGTEGEFDAYWQAKGWKAYKGWTYLDALRKRMDEETSSRKQP